MHIARASFEMPHRSISKMPSLRCVGSLKASAHPRTLLARTCMYEHTRQMVPFFSILVSTSPSSTVPRLAAPGHPRSDGDRYAAEEKISWRRRRSVVCRTRVFLWNRCIKIKHSLNNNQEATCVISCRCCRRLVQHKERSLSCKWS